MIARKSRYTRGPLFRDCQCRAERSWSGWGSRTATRLMKSHCGEVIAFVCRSSANLRPSRATLEQQSLQPVSSDDYLVVEIPCPMSLQLLHLCILSSWAGWAEVGKIHLPSNIHCHVIIHTFQVGMGGGDSDRMDSTNNILRDVIRV